MKRAILMIGALGLTAGLVAYGVSPSQYNAGQRQDQQGGLPNAPQPNPMTINQVAPGGQPNIQFQPQGQTQNQDFANAQAPDWAKDWKHWNWDDAKKAWESREGLFVDARSKMEYEQGHIPGAISIPVGEFDAQYEKYKSKIKSAKQIITYCHGVGCQLSNKVAQKFWQDKGMRNVGSFFGGWPQWQQHNMPVETGPEPKR